MTEAREPSGVVSAPDDKARLLDTALDGGSALVFHRGDEKTALDIRLCTKDRLDEIIALQRRVYDWIPDKDTFVRTTAEELAESLEQDFCIGAFSGNELAAFTLMVTGRKSPRNLAGLFGVSDEAARKSVTYDTTFVDPRFVGCGLQSYFITLKDRIAILLGADRAYATVSPDNMHSLNNMRANGFRTVGKKHLYGGHLRYILCKRLENG